MRLANSGIFLALALPCCASGETQSLTNSAAIIISDMKNASEALPHGVPETYGWPAHPGIASGNKPPVGFTTITAWGQVYAARDGSEVSNTRVEVRDLSLFVLKKSDGAWHCLQSARAVAGAAFREDFFQNENHAIDKKAEADSGISVRIQAGYNFHFWPGNSRAPIDSDDIEGLLVTFYAKLIQADPEKSDDRGTARYVASAGADYWTSKNAIWDHFHTNTPVGIGRFKMITPEWRAFNMTTLDESYTENLPSDVTTGRLCGVK